MTFVVSIAFRDDKNLKNLHIEYIQIEEIIRYIRPSSIMNTDSLRRHTAQQLCVVLIS